MRAFAPFPSLTSCSTPTEASLSLQLRTPVGIQNPVVGCGSNSFSLGETTPCYCWFSFLGPRLGEMGGPRFPTAYYLNRWSAQDHCPAIELVLK